MSVTRGRVSSRAVPCFRMQYANWRVTREIANETRRFGHPNALHDCSDNKGVRGSGIAIRMMDLTALKAGCFDLLRCKLNDHSFNP